MQREQTLMNNVAIVLTMSEQRAFLGAKKDGFVYLPNVEALAKFEKHIQRYRSHDEFSQIEHRELHALTADGVLALNHAVQTDLDRPWLWTKTDFTIKLW